MQIRIQYIAAVVLLWLFILPTTTQAFIIDINIDTSFFAGTSANLAFDFIDGDSTVNNVIQIRNFVTDGSYDPLSASTLGDVTGQLGATSFLVLSDNDLFNEWLQPITLGNALSFQLSSTDNFAGGMPDAFTFFILDDLNLFPLFTTTHVMDIDALFVIELSGTGQGNLAVYEALHQEAAWSVDRMVPVPEPTTWLLIGLGCAWILLSPDWLRPLAITVSDRYLIVSQRDISSAIRRKVRGSALSTRYTIAVSTSSTQASQIF